MSSGQQSNESNPSTFASPAWIVEGSEMAAWLNLWRAVPAPEAAAAGLHAVQTASGIALIFEKAPFWLVNRVLGAGLVAPLREADIDRLIALYDGKGLDFAISLSPRAQPAQAGHWLAKRGFTVVNSWAKMIRDDAPAPRIPTGFRIEKAEPEHAGIIGELVCAGFGVPDACKPVFTSALRADSNHVYVAFDEDTPVGVGMLSIGDGVGHLYTATTLPQFRSRGCQGALMAHRIKEGLRMGCTAFATETGAPAGASNPSYNNMLRCGFRPLYERPNYLHKSARR